MQKRRIIINAIISVIQVIVVSVALLIIYKFLLKTIGIANLGVWSLVMAVSSITQIGSFGLSGSVIKYVAKYIARDDQKNISNVIQTASLSIAVFIGIILLLCYPLMKWILSLVIDRESVPLALSILPFAFFALWIMMISSIFQAGLDGYQRIDLRSILLIASTILYSIFVFLITPVYGLKGLLYSQIIQNLSVFIGSWFLLKKFVPSLPVLPCKWDKNIFKEIVGYGINFQIITVTTMFYDPTTKSLLSKFGGLSMVGYYEMASKMIQQIRALIASANQVLVPTFADLQERKPEQIKEVYLTSYQLVFYLSLPLFSLIIICTSLISELWIGHYERNFVIFGSLLGIGWFLNTLSGPAYFANLGVGELHWNVASHIIVALLNAGLGLILGLYYDGFGIVIAWIISLGLGSSLICLPYHKKHRIPFMELVPKSSRAILLVCIIGILSTFMFQFGFNCGMNLIIVNGIIILLFLTFTVIFLWIHPMRMRLLKWVNQYIFKNS